MSTDSCGRLTPCVHLGPIGGHHQEQSDFCCARHTYIVCIYPSAENLCCNREHLVFQARAKHHITNCCNKQTVFRGWTSNFLNVNSQEFWASFHNQESSTALRRARTGGASPALNSIPNLAPCRMSSIFWVEDVLISNMRNVGKFQNIYSFLRRLAQASVHLYTLIHSKSFDQTLVGLCTRVLGTTHPAFSCPCSNVLTGKIRMKEPTCGRRGKVITSTRNPCQLFRLARSAPPRDCNIRRPRFPPTNRSTDMLTHRWNAPTGGFVCDKRHFEHTV